MDALARLNTALTNRYEVEREIGAGGMATVYLARDARHNRRVALKVLRPDLGAVLGVDRFLSEIQVTANLQHPNLLPLFDSGEADGLLFYVMPFVDGESLRARLDREKQLPLDDAVRISTAVASALDYAHRHGVIHRDLKPENILLHEGQPLVADFGIALAVSNAGGGRVTQTGISLGTPQYMSPEQATGDRAIDARTDIYSLGAVAYEMLTGEPPHIGNTAQAIIARVVTERPRTIRSTRSNVPEHIDAAIDRALEKLPADRWSTAQEFADALSGKVVALPTAARAAASVRGTATWRDVARHPLGVGALAVALVSLAALAFGVGGRDGNGARETITFELNIPEAPEGISLAPGPTPLAVSPDGRHYVYRARNADGVPQLVIRPASEPAGRWMPGTENAVNVAFSPDGASIAFMQTVNGPLMRATLSGGPPTRVASVGGGGMAWSDAGFVLGRGTGPLSLLSADGGEPRALTVLDSAAGETSHRYPVLLPDGEHVAFTAFIDRARARIGIASLQTGAESRLDISALGAVGYAGGYLVLHDGRSGLIGVPFDVRANRVVGPPVTLIDSVSFGSSGLVRAALSPSGTLIYLKGGATELERELIAIDLSGAERVVSPIRRTYSSPRYAPNGRRVAVEVQGDSASGIWMLDLGAGTIAPVTRGYWASRAEWSPDGREIAFMARVGAVRELRRQPSDGTAPAQLVLGSDDRGQPVQILYSRDARHFVYRTGFRTGGQRDAIWYRAWDGDTTVRPVSADSGVISRNPAISPDGKWIAYGSDESGTFQVYVRPFPGPGPRYAITADGGESPVWSPDGRKLYYVNGPLMEEAVVRFTPEFSVTRRPLFQHRSLMQDWTRNYDIAPDGSHFIFVRNPGAQQERTGDVVVIHNWAAQLEARRPTTGAR